MLMCGGTLMPRYNSRQSVFASTLRRAAEVILLGMILDQPAPAAADQNVAEIIRSARQSAPGIWSGPGGGVSSRTEPDPRASAIADSLSRMPGLRGSLTNAAPGGAKGSAAQKEAITLLQNRVGEEITVRLRAENQTAMQIRGRRLEPPAAGPSLAGPEEAGERTARGFLRKNRILLRLDDPDNELKLSRGERDDLGYRHLRFTQVHQGLPVWPAGLSVHLDPAGNVHLLDGAYAPSPSAVGTKPEIAAPEAARRAQAGVPGGSTGTSGQPELIVYAPLDKPPRLAWKLDVAVDLRHAWRVAVDALDGAILSRANQCMDAHVTGSGTDMAGVTRTLEVWQQGGTNYLIDTTKQMFKPAFDPIQDPHGAITVFDARDVTQAQLNQKLEVFFVTSASPTSWSPPDAVSAAMNFSQTYDYYLERHGRDSVDGEGGNITAAVRISQLDNAFWNGQLKMMFFGDVQPYAKALDVIGHELTHGVTQHSAGLVYENQPGALNEAFSDIFGEMVEARTVGQPDWLVGTQLAQPARDMRNPSSMTIGGLNRPYPSKMSEYLQLPNNEGGDSGGVHLNSSIVNHAYYLLAAGLDGNVGLRDAERIFYRCLTQHLQPQSQFVDARLGCIAAAEALFGQDSSQARKVAEAFDAVEIVAAPSAPPPSPTPVVQGPDSTLFIYFETGGFLFDYVLGRRETARGDGNSGVALAGPTRLARPSVLGDGSVAVFVDSTYDLAAVDTVSGFEQRLGYAGQVHSVAASPNGQLYAFVLRDPFTGQPGNQITVLDLVNKTNRTFKLVAPVVDGAPVDNVLNADAMVFSTDNRFLIYDAVSQIHFRGVGAVERWSLFAIDLASEQTAVIVPPLEDLNTGNPAMGRAGNRFLTFDAEDTRTTNSTIINLDLFSGDMAAVGTNAFGLGYPCFSGDESAVIYGKEDANAVWTGTSLVKQPLAANRLTPVGRPTLWVQDAPIGVIYRRGTYVSSNALPQVTISAPANNSTFDAPATVTLTAAASDADGQIAKVEFYQGSTKLGEATAAPFTQTFSNVPAGNYRLIARAIDNLGGTADSTPVNITVGQSLPPPSLVITSFSSANGAFEFAFRSERGKAYDVEASTDLVSWTSVGSVAANTDSATFRDAPPAPLLKRFYRVRYGAAAPGAPSITTQPLTQTVSVGANVTLTVAATGANLRYQWKRDGTVLNGKTAASLELTAVTAADAGAYVVEVSNASGSVTSQAAIITISAGSPVATLPEPNRLYPEGTRFGGSLFGVEFTIPPKWKGGLKAKTPLMLFGSDTEPGLIMETIGFAWTQDEILRDPGLAGGFESDMGTPVGKVQFRPTNPASPLTLTGTNRISGEFSGWGRDQAGNAILIYYNLELVTHPSGGFVVFIGITTQEYHAENLIQLKAFAAAVIVTPRPTNHDYMTFLNGRSYKGAGSGHDWYTSQPGIYSSSASTSSWSENYSSFCAQGTFKVDTTSEFYASTTSPSSGYMSLSDSSTTTEYGQWTIVQTPEYGNVMLLVTLNNGYLIVPVKIEGDGTLFVGQNKLTPYGTFNCQ